MILGAMFFFALNAVSLYPMVTLFKPYLFFFIVTCGLLVETLVKLKYVPPKLSSVKFTEHTD